MNQPKEKDALIQDILNTIKAGECYISGDLVFALAFRSKSELIEIARALYIKESESC